MFRVEQARAGKPHEGGANVRGQQDLQGYLAH